MSDSKSSLRIDWFDGTLIEDTRQNATTSSQFAEEDIPETETKLITKDVEKKPIGFKRLMDLSFLKPPVLNLEISHRPGFWHLLDIDLKGDFIVLIIKILSNIYNSLEFEDKSKITILLRTRFLKSVFINNLKNYLSQVPHVRIVEKKVNMQLWDDVETFYLNMFVLCEGMYKFHRNDSDVLFEVLELLEITETSAIGVREEHTETIRDSFFTDLDQLKKDILIKIKRATNESIPKKVIADPTNYKNLQIFPMKDDLLGDSKIKIQPNIINGSYLSVEHYLDLQFKLLREDCFAPLREGICKYMENPAKHRHENIRVYPKVRIIRTYVSNNKVGHLVDIAWQDRLENCNIDKKHYAYNKKLMFGSLLLFTCDQFETILCASVLDSSQHLLAEGYIVASFENAVSNKIYTEAYLMVESEVYFEPYHRVLKVLQSMRPDDMPMKDYILYVQAVPQPPEYLTSDTMYSVSGPDGEDINFTVLDTEQWPTSDSLGLDDSQMEAYQFALTRQFAVVQGPPGTGKTFLGIKIASTLLKNLSLEGTPMIIMCYTNHALDQFLEGVLDVTKSVVRLGTQSKSKVLQDYTLSSVRGRTKSRYSHLYASKRAELERLHKEMTEVQTEIDKCESEIVSYRTLKPYLKVGDKSYASKTTNEDPIVSWLFNHLEGEAEGGVEESEDWEQQCEELSVSDGVETCFSERRAIAEIQSLNSSIECVKAAAEDAREAHDTVCRLEKQITRLRNRLNYFKRQARPLSAVQAAGDGPAAGEARWLLYRGAAAALKDDLVSKLNALSERHRSCSAELEDVRTVLDGELVRGARVLGVTTTAAARRHDLLRALLSPIVIVEEAAEVLEAHIVSSLTAHCQHLVLIGDHKQLRPSAAHYQLARDYNLEVSLFERMVRNGVHARTLRTQRRMRADVAQLLVPVVYRSLDTHPSVRAYPDVRGMRDNLYFYTHNRFEDSEGLEDSWSHRNMFEARWCVSLANYLRRRALAAQHVTVLAAYAAQAALLTQLSRKYDLLKDVKITVVDNYQGEENRIVILSLVRSNARGDIGFLGASHRVCVAMSRARHGFYIFGNMELLQSASTIWASICHKLKAQNALGSSLVLRCETHKHVTYEVESPEEFDDCLSPGECFKTCP